MSIERLVLPFENDVPVGCTIERLTMAMLTEEDGWMFAVKGELEERPRTRLRALSADISRRLGTNLTLYNDDDGYVYGAQPDWTMVVVFTYRVRFDAGPVADYEPLPVNPVFEKGEVIRDPSGLFYVISPQPDGLSVWGYFIDDDEKMDKESFHDIPNSVLSGGATKYMFVRVHARDAYVLK